MHQNPAYAVFCYNSCVSNNYTTPRERTSALIDALLRFVAVGGTITASLALPGLIIGLDKPLQKFIKSLDSRDRQREINRVLRYMKQKDLIRHSGAGRFEHGITISKRGRDRLAKINFKNLKINQPKKWDEKWRLVVFDIPESEKFARDSLTLTLHRLGFQPLQRSVWIFPHPCHEEIEAACLYHKVDKYVTYLETSYIDKEKKLKSKFSKII